MKSSSPTDSQALVGTTFGNSYVLERIVGQGRHGALFDARHVRLGHRCAVRVLRVDNTRRTALLGALSQHGSLQHPHLNPPHDVIPLSETELLVSSALLSGMELNQRVAAHGKLTASEGVVMLRQAASALHALHQKGICHGNLTATNIFFSRFDDVSIDNALGDSKGSNIVQLIDPALSLLDGANPTPADDIRSLGRIMLAFVADLTSAQRQVLERTQDTRPDSRFASVADLFQAFEKTHGGRGQDKGGQGEGKATSGRSVATAVVTPIKLPPPGLAARRRLMVAGGGALGLLLIIGLAWVSRSKSPSPPPAPPAAPAAAPVDAPPPEPKVEEKPAAPAPAAEPSDDGASEKRTKKKKKKSKGHASGGT